jgi:hypothetical protein
MSYADLNSPTTLLDLVPIAARTASGFGAAQIDVRNLKGIGVLLLLAQAGTGTTPTLAVRVQDSEDGSSGWANMGINFVQVAAADSTQRIPIDLDACRGFIRIAWTIGGTTPSFTFGVAGLGRSF